MTGIPMTSEQFFGIFRAYNTAVWPAPVVLTLLALLAAYRAARSNDGRDGLAVIVLAMLWAWSGVAYHLVHHAPYNPAAAVFGVLFVIQAGVFLWTGFGGQGIRFGLHADRYGIAGAVLMLYALILYPLIGYALGHRYPETPTFGAPCPVTIFTFGLLLWTVGRIRPYVLVVPFIWALVAVGAAVGWGVLEDLGMPLAALVSTVLLLSRNRIRRTDESRAGDLPVERPADHAAVG